MTLNLRNKKHYMLDTKNGVGIILIPENAHLFYLCKWDNRGNWHIKKGYDQYEEALEDYKLVQEFLEKEY